MIINKSQGQTLKNVGLQLPKQVFSHGQLYVAILRVTSKKGLKILVDDPGVDDHGMIMNIVHEDIFKQDGIQVIVLANLLNLLSFFLKESEFEYVLFRIILNLSNLSHI